MKREICVRKKNLGIFTNKKIPSRLRFNQIHNISAQPRPGPFTLAGSFYSALIYAHYMRYHHPPHTPNISQNGFKLMTMTVVEWNGMASLNKQSSKERKNSKKS